MLRATLIAKTEGDKTQQDASLVDYTAETS